MTILLTLVFIMAAGVSCSACPTHCSCYSTEVVCTTAGAYSSFQQLVNELPSGASSLSVELQTFERLNFNSLDVAKLSSLIQLDITYSRVNTIDANFFTALPRLQTLSLSYNNLSNIPSGTFSPLKILASLYLANNTLRVVSDGLLTGLDSLVTLDLDANGLHHIHTRAFTHLSKLQTLKLSRNNLPDVVSNINDFFNPESSLQRLYLDSNGITRIPEGWVRNLPNLGYVTLKKNSIISIHPSAFDTLNKIKHLFLNGNQLTTVQFSVETSWTHLETLEISGNQIFQLRGTELNNMGFLKKLDMSKNKLTSLANKLFEHNPLLETIILSSNELVSVVSGVFNDLTFLKVLDLRHNPLCSLIQQAAQLSTNPKRVFIEIERCKGSTTKTSTTQVSASVPPAVSTPLSVSPVSHIVTNSGPGDTTNLVSTPSTDYPVSTTTSATRNTEHDEEDDTSDDPFLIVGIVLGVFFFLILVALVAYCCVRKHKRTTKPQTSEHTAGLSEYLKGNQDQEMKFSNQVYCKDANAVAVEQKMANKPRQQEDFFLASGNTYASIDEPESRVRYSGPPTKEELQRTLEPPPTYEKISRSPASIPNREEGQYQDLAGNRGRYNPYQAIVSEMYATPPQKDDSEPLPPNERVSTATYDYIKHPDENGYIEPLF